MRNRIALFLLASLAANAVLVGFLLFPASGAHGRFSIQEDGNDLLVDTKDKSFSMHLTFSDDKLLSMSVDDQKRGATVAFNLGRDSLESYRYSDSSYEMATNIKSKPGNLIERKEKIENFTKIYNLSDHGLTTVTDGQ